MTRNLKPNPSPTITPSPKPIPDPITGPNPAPTPDPTPTPNSTPADPEAREAERALRKRIDDHNAQAGTLNLGPLLRTAVGGPSGAGGGGGPADPGRGYATRARPDDGLEQSRAYAMRQRH